MSGPLAILNTVPHRQIFTEKFNSLGATACSATCFFRTHELGASPLATSLSEMCGFPCFVLGDEFQVMKVLRAATKQKFVEPVGFVYCNIL